MCVCLCEKAAYFVIKELQNKGGHAAVDADEDVDAGQHHVGRAGHAEDEGGRVHHGGDGPPEENKKKTRNTVTPNGSPDLMQPLNCGVKV